MRKWSSLFLTICFLGMLIFSGKAMATPVTIPPAFSVSNVTSDYSPSGINVEFDAYPSGGWTLDSTSVWVETAYYMGWQPLYDASRSDYQLKNTTGNHWVMNATGTGFGAIYGVVGSLADVVKDSGFYIGYWDGVQMGQYFHITADGIVHNDQGVPQGPTWAFAPVPEPMSLLLLGSGLVSLVGLKKKK